MSDELMNPTGLHSFVLNVMKKSICVLMLQCVSMRSVSSPEFYNRWGACVSSVYGRGVGESYNPSNPTS